MGTINYGTSKYITMGLPVLCKSDYEDDEEFMEVITEQAEEYDFDIDECIYEYIYTSYDDDAFNAECYLEQNYDFRMFDVKIEPGYYEGYYIDIGFDYECFDDEEERQDVYREIEQLEAFLHDIADCGFCCVWPGWCTKELSYDDTLSAIDEAVEEIKQEVKNKPLRAEYEAV